jgi:2-dehydro-3-deoxy-D-gluconate 5-dehydrogenase
MHKALFDLTGRVAIVTGGNGGIGLGMARGLAAAGASIVIAGRNQAKSEAAVTELATGGVKAIALAVDVNDSADVKAMVADTLKAFGRVDILVNNAGMNVRKTPDKLALEEWENVIKTNLTSAFVISQAVHPAMKEAGGGKIINIGSMMSIFGAVLPGWIDTELTQNARREVDGLHDRVLARSPSGRWGAPGDFAGIAVFLASRASDFVTGAAIPVDGGFSVQG